MTCVSIKESQGFWVLTSLCLWTEVFIHKVQQQMEEETKFCPRFKILERKYKTKHEIYVMFQGTKCLGVQEFRLAPSGNWHKQPRDDDSEDETLF